VDAPSSTGVSFAVRRGNVASTDVATLLTTFLASTVQALSKAPATKQAAHLGAEQPSKPRGWSLACQDPDDEHSNDERYVAAVAPAAAFETQALIFGPLDKK